MRLLRTLVGYGSALYLTLLLVIVGFGVASPREGDDVLLAQAGLPAPALLVGMKSTSGQTPRGFRTAESRYYMVLPRSFAARSVWVVSRDEDSAPRVVPSMPAFWWVFGMALLSTAGVLWYALRPENGRADEAAVAPPPGSS